MVFLSVELSRLRARRGRRRPGLDIDRDRWHRERVFQRYFSRLLACTLAVAFFLTPPPPIAGEGDAGAAPPGVGEQTTTDEPTIDELLELHHSEQEKVRLVLLPTVVTNRRGKIITNLEPTDFRLYEDYVPQRIRYFSKEAKEPISIAFLLDISGSMRQVGKLDEAKQAIRIFVDALNPRDRFGLICFADDQVAWITEFTTDRRTFLRRLQVQEAYGQTALFDAVAATPRLVDEKLAGRKAIVLITDGDDNASRLNTFKAVQLARSVNVPIYTIGFASMAERFRLKGSSDPDLVVLRRFAAETGGTLFPVRDPDDLKEAVLQIQRELRFQYVIGYHPTRKTWDGSFRRIKLDSTRAHLRVRTRSGYYALP
jgi:Ca-activated chloride channel family protein